MLLRPYVKDDYATICSWYEAHWEHGIPQSILPPIGYIVTDSGVAIAVGFLLTSDCPVSMLEYVAVNPSLGGTSRVRACKMIFDAAKKDSIALNGKTAVIYSISGNESYHRLIQSAGFKVGEKNVTSFVWTPVDADIDIFTE